MPLGDAIPRSARYAAVPDPVDDDLVLELIGLAVRAPSAENHQNWDFVVVRDPAVKHQLARLNRQAWSIGKRVARRKVRTDWRMEGVIDAIQWQADHFEETPVVIVACLRGMRLSRLLHVGAASYYGSIFPAVRTSCSRPCRGTGQATLTTIALWSVDGARPPHHRLPLGRDAVRGRPHRYGHGGHHGPTTAVRPRRSFTSTGTGTGLPAPPPPVDAGGLRRPRSASPRGSRGRSRHVRDQWCSGPCRMARSAAGGGIRVGRPRPDGRPIRYPLRSVDIRARYAACGGSAIRADRSSVGRGR